jgi:hypothetical protein|tara:strand:+ start:2301 stop:2651 length:351 start_codon:yes stop_codon:yes gene_type:complete
MVDADRFALTREEIEGRLRWYERKFGPYIRKRGMHNIKNLFRKPNLQDWTILFMMVMLLFAAWAYNNDTANCREFLDNLEHRACSICRNQIADSTGPHLDLLDSEETNIIGDKEGG